ncbi:MAG TPA: tetraacyldisaccharide 4'-kinase [Xanthomonadaceae bacterium]|nr:tetraacyldisaccharide 4'-kinase [Xanthomonadaceae bacterium]
MNDRTLAAAIRRRWDSPPPLLLRLPARVFGAVVRLRRTLYRLGWLRSRRAGVPVIVVGNLVAGGAGKTPLVAVLAQELRRRGLRPGVVSRGYRRGTRGAHRVGPGDKAAAVGDEPRLFADLGLPVAVAARRIEAARLLSDRCDVLLADDGLQHYALARDLEIAVVDGVRRFGNGWLLPAGPLREPCSRLEEVDFVVCNGGRPQPGEVTMALEPGDARSLAEPGHSVPLARWEGAQVDAVAGIADPERFFASLRARGLDVCAHAFPDHHPYRLEDFGFAGERPLLMTSKDAVKCRAFARPGWFEVPVQAMVPPEFLDAVHARVLLARGAEQ